MPKSTCLRFLDRREKGGVPEVIAFRLNETLSMTVYLAVSPAKVGENIPEKEKLMQSPLPTRVELTTYFLLILLPEVTTFSMGIYIISDVKYVS